VIFLSLYLVILHFKIKPKECAMRLNMKTIVAVLCFFSYQSQATKPITISSTKNQTTFLELYTSQGCSSCPPAERWLSKLTDRADLWSQIIPINFHVNYWDYLGWKDPFAATEFNKRQRVYKALGHSKIVATPGFIVNGQGWQGWFYKQSLPKTEKIYSGDLTATLNTDRIHVEYSANIQQNLIAHIAVLGFGIETPIKSGENSGRNLKHDFVVIGHQQHNMLSKQGSASTLLTMPTTVAVPTNKKAVVFWVAKENDPTPLQVAANWL
jgi:hypothetical protein